MEMAVTPLERLRREADLSRPAVASALGISERHLYRFERGVTRVRRPYAKVLAEVYELPLKTVEAAAEDTLKAAA